MQKFSYACEKLEFYKILEHLQRYATSKIGKEEILKIFPSTNKQEIVEEHQKVSEVKLSRESGETFSLDGIKDIRTALQKANIENALLTSRELLDIASTIQVSKKLQSFFEKHQEQYPLMHAKISTFEVQSILEYNITQAIDDDGRVKDSASKELREIRKTILHHHNHLQKQLENILRNVSEQGMVRDDIITTRDGRMVIAVKSEHKNKVSGFIHSTSASGMTVFIEPTETLSTNNELCTLGFQEQREIEKILRTLTQQVHHAREELSTMLKILVYVDVLVAKAKYSTAIHGEQPFIKHDGYIKINNARHPILLLKHPYSDVVPLSMELGKDFTTLLITGPNAGGKSVVLKSIGLLTLLVQSGIHIPVSADSEFPIFQNIALCIGDEQSLENDLSTYSSQIVRLKEIVEHVHEHNLVLLDEMGSGTDPAEGSAIAAAILQYLTNAKVLTIATTHHGLLKIFAHETKGMYNAAMEFDTISLQPTYQLRMGIPGSSYALEIAQRFGMSHEILDFARSMVGEQKFQLEKLLLDIETRSQKLSEQIKILEEEKLHYQKLQQEYETQRKSFQKEMREIKRNAVQEAKTLVEKANLQIEHLVKELREKQAEKDAIRSTKNALAEMKKDIYEEEKMLGEEIHTQHFFSLQKGDIVQLRNNSQKAEVLTIPDESGYFFAAFNSLKMKIHNSDVILMKKTEEKKSITTFTKTSENKIDIRGMYGEEAVAVLDKFLDDAVVAGLHKVEIIHGKGTGALRRHIQQFLENDKRVMNKRFGEWNEGGMGVTIVEI